MPTELVPLAMRENEQSPPIRGGEKDIDETIADARTLAELNRKAAEQLKKLGQEMDAKPDRPESES